MSIKRRNSSNQNSDSIQLSLFNESLFGGYPVKNTFDYSEILENDNLKKKSSANILEKQKKDEITDELDARQTIYDQKAQIEKFILPLSYEEIVIKMGHQRGRMAEFIVPVTEF